MLQAFSAVGRALWFARLVDNMTPSHEFQGKIIPDDGSTVRYTYDWDDWGIGPASVVGTPEQVMAYFIENPRRIFPFGLGQCDPIVEQARCDLETGPRNYAPVIVSSIAPEGAPTSFTFTTLEEHFDGPGGTIKFTIEKRPRDGVDWIYLRTTADAPNADDFFDLVAPPIARLMWLRMRNNLRQVFNPNFSPARPMPEAVP
jgi:hypothetical protein